MGRTLNNFEQYIEKLFNKQIIFIKFLCSFGLTILLIKTSYEGNLEPLFLLSGIAITLGSFFVTIPKDYNKFKSISKDFILSGIMFILSISIGGIFLLFGKNISLYHIFSYISFIELMGNLLVGALYGLFGIFVITGVFYFIESVFIIMIIVIKENNK